MFRFLFDLFLDRPVVAKTASVVVSGIVVDVVVVDGVVEKVATVAKKQQLTYSQYLAYCASHKRDVCFSPKGWLAYNKGSYLAH